MSYIQNTSLSHALLLQADQALLSYGFDLNPYDLCVVNNMVNGESLLACG